MANIEASFAQPLFSPVSPPSKFPALPVPALPILRSGLARGSIIEIVGGRSSGRMAATLHVLAQGTARGEICAVVDAKDQFHPASAAAAGVKLSRLLWVRCRGNGEHALRAADLLLHAGGFGVVVLDLCELKSQVLNRIPLSYWYRFRRAIEQTPTVLLVCTSSAQTRACVQHVELQLQRPRWDGTAPFAFLQGLDISARLRKPIAGLVEQLSLEKAG